MKDSLSKQKGISLVEILVVTASLSFLAILIASIPNAITSISKSRHRSLAKDIAVNQINSIRQVGFSNLANGTTSFSNSDLARLPQGTGNQEIEDCPVEICTNNERAKRVKVVVSWSDGVSTQSAELVTLVGQGGIGQ